MSHGTWSPRNNYFINGPYSELTCQPGRGILRAMDRAGTSTAKTGGPEPGNKGTIDGRALWSDCAILGGKNLRCCAACNAAEVSVIIRWGDLSPAA